MPEILTDVSAHVAEDREADLVRGYRELVAQPTPDGLLRTELVQGADGLWRILTLWRDRDALEAVRSGSRPPAAPALFRSVGAEPSLQVYEVRRALDTRDAHGSPRP